jgi:hypothetical protein
MRDQPPVIPKSSIESIIKASVREEVKQIEQEEEKEIVKEIISPQVVRGFQLLRERKLGSRR